MRFLFGERAFDYPIWPIGALLNKAENAGELYKT